MAIAAILASQQENGARGDPIIVSLSIPLFVIGSSKEGHRVPITSGIKGVMEVMPICGATVTADV